MNKLFRKIKFTCILFIVIIFSFGCSNTGVWYIGNKAITKDPETGETLTRQKNQEYEGDVNRLYDENRMLGKDPYEGIPIPFFSVPVGK